MYPKLLKEERLQTSSGGAVSLIALGVILVLLASELLSYFAPTSEHHISVDSSMSELLRIDLNVTFHALHCGEVHLDAMDVAGDQQDQAEHSLRMQRLSKGGQPVESDFEYLMPWEQQDLKERLELDEVEGGTCGSCYGAETPRRRCCNTCEEVKTAYVERGWDARSVSKSASQCKTDSAKKVEAMEAAKGHSGEGCNVAGHILVHKLAGNLNVAMGDVHVRDGHHIHQFNPADVDKYNISHTIHRLSFGHAAPGLGNPLQGIRQFPDVGSGVQHYHIKLVPTTLTGQGPGGADVNATQYSVTQMFTPAIVNGIKQQMLPGIFFIYDFSPFRVLVTPGHSSFVVLLTSICALVGGLYTVAGLADALVGVVSHAAGGRQPKTMF